ncbi:hypothetical protein HY992_06085 [Candidatus Micrarchaeota archaeon]|nr:hypothetical protein [Candidatus Micrarchaeota archaeon]
MEPNLTGYVRKLEKYGLVSVVRKGRSKEVALSSAVGFGFYLVRKDFPQLKLADILVGYNQFLLSFIKSRDSFKLKELDLPAPTAKRLLARLRSLGLVSMPKKGMYRLRKEAEPVADFCRQTIRLACSEEAVAELSHIDHAIFSFDSAKELEAIFVTPGQAKPRHYWPTFYGITHEYGLQLLPSGKYYYANKKPDLGDLIIHTLAIQKNTRGIVYAAFLALKNKYNVKLLLNKRQTFGVGKDYIVGFVNFIESRGKTPFGGLASLEELRSVGYEAV